MLARGLRALWSVTSRSRAESYSGLSVERPMPSFEGAGLPLARVVGRPQYRALIPAIHNNTGGSILLVLLTPVRAESVATYRVAPIQTPHLW